MNFNEFSYIFYRKNHDAFDCAIMRKQNEEIVYCQNYMALQT